MSEFNAFSVTGNGATQGSNVSVPEAHEFHLIGSGTGSFKLEFLMSNNQWQSSADSTFDSPCNKLVSIAPGNVRLSIVTGNLHVECRPGAGA